MTESEARARFIFLAATEDEPTLGSALVDMFLTMSRVADVNRIEPTHPNWIPTWDLNYAISQAWLYKAGRLSGRYLFMSGGKMFARQQMFDHCMKMYQKYAMKSGIKSVRLGPEDELLEEVSLLGNWNANNT